MTDLHLNQLYKSLEKTRISHKHPRVDTGMQMDVWFEPEIVIEVSASEITFSPSHCRHEFNTIKVWTCVEVSKIYWEGENRQEARGRY